MMTSVLFHLLVLLLCGQAIGQIPQPTKILVRGVELHYIEQGQGEPLILLHGGQGDYRSWEPQMKRLSPQYRVISYSRRYNYPNDNPLTAKNHSAYVEAADLAGFIHAELPLFQGSHSIFRSFSRLIRRKGKAIAYPHSNSHW